MSWKHLLSGSAVVVAVVATIAGDAEAIPAWARKYGTSCVTCHEAFPRLNASGEAFRLNGYRFGEMDEAYIRQEPNSLGDPAYKRVWPDSVWPSDIPGNVPIAIRATMDYDVKVGDGSRENSFRFPSQGKILAGGTFGDSVSFFFELEIDGADGEVDLAAFLNFEDLFSDAVGENLLNLRVGNVGMQEMDLPNTRGHQLFTRYGYLKNEYMVPYPTGFGEENKFMMHHQVGIMLYGFGSRWWGAVGLVNGQGGIDDVNPEKDVFVQLNFKIGGLGFDASAPSGADDESDEIPTKPSGHWVDNSLRFGFFGYYGLADVVDPLGFAEEDRFWRAGADVRWKIGDVSLAGGVITGDNDRPYGTVLGDNVAATIWFAEGEWFVYPWLIATVRYESLTANSPDDIFANDFDRARFVPGLTVVFRANIRIVLEGMFYATNKPRTDTPGGKLPDDNVVGVRLDVAF